VGNQQKFGDIFLIENRNRALVSPTFSAGKTLIRELKSGHQASIESGRKQHHHECSFEMLYELIAVVSSSAEHIPQIIANKPQVRPGNLNEVKEFVCSLFQFPPSY
jgi:hypothetical protein